MPQDLRVTPTYGLAPPQSNDVGLDGTNILIETGCRRKPASSLTWVNAKLPTDVVNKSQVKRPVSASRDW